MEASALNSRRECKGDVYQVSSVAGSVCDFVLNSTKIGGQSVYVRTYAASKFQTV